MFGARNDIRPLIQKGLVAFHKEEWESAISFFEKALQSDPSHPVPCFYASLAHLALNQNDQAEALVKAGLEKSPLNVLGWNIMAILAFRRNARDEAVEVLDRFGMVEHPAVQAFTLLEIEKAVAGLES